MWLQFILENVHFAINLFAALVFFATTWLYFDAWLDRKTAKEALKISGFFLITISFLIHATAVESVILQSSLLGGEWNRLAVAATLITGFILLITGLIVEPLQAHPHLKKKQSVEAGLILPVVTLSALRFLPVVFPILATITAFLYIRRATIGLEDHVKPVAVTFYVLALYELLALAESLQGTTNVDLYNLVAPFAPLWIIQHLVLVVAVLILGHWVYFYLLKRLQSQLFMIFAVVILVVFLLTTITFTALLLKNLQDETLKRLETDVKVLSYAVESKKGENISDAGILAQDTQIIDAVDVKDIKSKKLLRDNAQSFLLNKKESILVIVSDTGVVLARGEDTERVGDSISDDPLIKRVLLGESASSVVTKDGVLGPEVSLRSATPIKKEGKIIGAVMVGTTIDNAFVDGIKEATGLEAAVYGDNILSATTLVAADGKSRYIGVREEGESVKGKVLSKGESYTGPVNLLNTPYFAAYLPLKDVDTNPVGMLFVGKPQVGVLQAAGRSIELTFLVAVILLVLSVFPAYFIAKYLTNQIH